MTNTNVKYTNMVLAHPIQLNTVAGMLHFLHLLLHLYKINCIKLFSESGPDLLPYIYTKFYQQFDDICIKLLLKIWLYMDQNFAQRFCVKHNRVSVVLILESQWYMYWIFGCTCIKIFTYIYSFHDTCT